MFAVTTCSGRSSGGSATDGPHPTAPTTALRVASVASESTSPSLGRDHVVSLAYYPRPEGTTFVASYELGGVNSTSRAVAPILAALPAVLPPNPAQSYGCGDGRLDASVVVGFDDGTHYDYGPCTWPDELWPAITALTLITKR